MFGDVDASILVNHELILMIAMLARDSLVFLRMLVEKAFHFLVHLLFSFKHAIAEWKVSRVVFLACFIMFLNKYIEFFIMAWFQVPC